MQHRLIEKAKLKEKDSEDNRRNPMLMHNFASLASSRTILFFNAPTFANISSPDHNRVCPSAGASCPHSSRFNTLINISINSGTAVMTDLSPSFEITLSAIRKSNRCNKQRQGNKIIINLSARAVKRRTEDRARRRLNHVPHCSRRERRGGADE